MTKKYNLFLIALFCGFLLFFLAAGILTPDRERSGREVLQQRPMPNGSSLLSGKFMTDFEKYCGDQFFAREGLIDLKARAELAVGKQENNGVYVCKDDVLISRFDEPDQKKIAANADYVNQFAANAGVPVYFSLVPGQAAIWADRLPKDAPNADQEAIIDGVYAQSKAQHYDSFTPLKLHRDEPIYYRTDHHWTSLGAYYGYAALMEALGMEAVPLSAYEKTVVSENFRGTTLSTSGLRGFPPDSIWTYVPEGGIEVTSCFSTKPEPGKLYHPDKLEGIDQYPYFMGGNQVLSIIKNPAVQGGRKLLLLRDSYADAMIPFLTPHFSEIHMIDLRYNKNSVPKYIKENGIDLAVVLYSVPNFVSDANFFTLRQK